MGRFRAACPVAVAATAGFAVFEDLLDRLLDSVGPATLFAVRALVTLPLMLLVLHLLGRPTLRELRRVACRPLHWLRGLCWSATAYPMILSAATPARSACAGVGVVRWSDRSCPDILETLFPRARHRREIRPGDSPSRAGPAAGNEVQAKHLKEGTRTCSRIGS